MLKELIKAGEQKIIAAQNYPHVDTKTGKIYNCKKNSKEYWHEKAHLEFAKLPITSALQMWQGIISFLWMISVTIAIVSKGFFIMALLFLGLYSFIEIYEEYWCNQYSKNKMKKKKDL